MVKAVTLGGTDVTNEPFEPGAATRYRLDVVLTDRVCRLSGTVSDRSARPVPNALVGAFPEDVFRQDGSRLIRTTFSGQLGHYELTNLPAGQYRVAAVTGLPRGAWTDPAILERLWSASASAAGW